MNREIRFFAPGEFTRLILLGSGSAGVAAAQYCIAHDIAVEVFLGPRQADDRGATDQTIVERYAGLDLPVRIEESLRQCDGGPYDTADAGTLVFSFGSPYIIPAALLELYGNRVVNSHGAPLPEWRGGGGFSWRIMAGDNRGNTCFHQVTPGIDDGPILFQEAYEFSEDARYPLDWQRIADERASSSVVAFLDRLRNGDKIELLEQDESLATYFPRLHTPTQAFIDWTWRGSEIELFIRSFSYPYSGARTTFGEHGVAILDAFFVEEPTLNHPFLRGMVYRADQSDLFVAVDGGGLRLPRAHFRCEGAPKEGDRFVTPARVLAEARGFRPSYTPVGLKK
jgi:methionyl-tRNA formyltransferase